jgi:hypothetical protein
MAWPGVVEICEDFKGTCCLNHQIVEENATVDIYVNIMQIILWMGSHE